MIKKHSSFKLLCFLSFLGFLIAKFLQKEVGVSPVFLYLYP